MVDVWSICLVDLYMNLMFKLIINDLLIDLGNTIFKRKCAQNNLIDQKSHYSYNNPVKCSIGHMEKMRNTKNMIITLTFSQIEKQSTTL